jgi:CO/xanthine dehydrogenase FAD-binding subunit
VERLVAGKPVEPELVKTAKAAAMALIQPIDDIRSSARYRTAVAGNLVAEFFNQLHGSENRNG